MFVFWWEMVYRCVSPTPSNEGKVSDPLQYKVCLFVIGDGLSVPLFLYQIWLNQTFVLVIYLLMRYEIPLHSHIFSNVSLFECHDQGK